MYDDLNSLCLLLRIFLILFPSIFPLNTIPSLRRITKLLISTFTLRTRSQPSVRKTPPHLSQSNSPIRQSIRFASLDTMCPV